MIVGKGAAGLVRLHPHGGQGPVRGAQRGRGLGGFQGQRLSLVRQVESRVLPQDRRRVGGKGGAGRVPDGRRLGVGQGLLAGLLAAGGHRGPRGRLGRYLRRAEQLLVLDYARPGARQSRAGYAGHAARSLLRRWTGRILGIPGSSVRLSPGTGSRILIAHDVVGDLHVPHVRVGLVLTQRLGVLVASGRQELHRVPSHEEPEVRVDGNVEEDVPEVEHGAADDGTLHLRVLQQEGPGERAGRGGHAPEEQLHHAREAEVGADVGHAHDGNLGHPEPFRGEHVEGAPALHG